MKKNKKEKAIKRLTVGGLVLGLIGWILAVITGKKYNAERIKAFEYRSKAIQYSGTLSRKADMICEDRWTLSCDKQIVEDAKEFYDNPNL